MKRDAAKSNQGLSAAGKAAETDAESGRSGPSKHTPREVKAKAGLTKAVLTKFYEEHDESKLSQIEIILDHPGLTPGLIHETCLDKYGSTPYGKYFSAMSTPQSPNEVGDNSVQGMFKYFSLYSVYIQCEGFAKLTFILTTPCKVSSAGGGA